MQQMTFCYQSINSIEALFAKPKPEDEWRPDVPVPRRDEKSPAELTWDKEDVLI